METYFTSDPWEQSLAQVRKVSPGPKLFKRIQYAIPMHKKVSNRTVGLVAASLFALVAINLLLLQYRTTTDSKITFINSTLNQSNQLYN